MDLIIKRKLDGDELRIHKDSRGNITIITVVKDKEVEGLNLTGEEVSIINALVAGVEVLI